MLRFHFLLCFLVAVKCSEDPEVTIEDGALRGKTMTSRGGRKFSAFMGIPYAKPPLGKLRFMAPQPSDPWDGVLDATKVHPVCPQRDVYRRTELIEGSENCLFLNVYTPKLPTFENQPLPVMVFFHGGGWLCGGGNSLWYGPDIFLDRDIVLVVTNYRLGALGFLTTGDEVVPGNNGLKDQNLALKWVKKHIENFGGDPDNVTIFGESAGGASVHYHTLSPMSRGLFKSGIAQSGTALCNWAFASTQEVVNVSKKLAESVKCPTEPSQAMVDCLRNVDAVTFVKKDKIFMEWDYDPMIPFKPVVEPKVKGAFLDMNVIDAIKSGKAVDIPIMIGLNTQDGALKAAAFHENHHLIEEIDKDFDKIIPISLLNNKNITNQKLALKKLREYYFGDERIDKGSVPKLIDLWTDGWFLNCADSAVILHRKHYRQPVYYYLFGYRGVASLTELFGGGKNDYGVCHADELQYLFPIGDSLFPDRKPSQVDKKVAETMTTLWSNFARTGNPTPDLNDIITEKWKPVASKNMEYYYIDSKPPRMRDGLFLERAKLWRSFSADPEINQVKDEL